MSGTNDKQIFASPSEIAREALRRLALSRIAPTPDNFRKFYHEISGSKVGPNPGSVIEDLIIDLRKYFPDCGQALNHLEKAVLQANWIQSSEILHDIISRVSLQATHNAKGGGNANALVLIAATDLLVQTLRLGVEPRLEHIPNLSADLGRVIDGLRKSDSVAAFEKAGSALKKIWLNLELQQTGNLNQQEALRELLQLLLQNIGELVEEDSWLRGQLEIVSKMVEGPIDVASLHDAEKRLKDVIFKQGLIKHSLREATSTLKTTMKTFISRMGEAVESTGEYQDKISSYAERISNTENVHELNAILESVLKDTRSMQATTRSTHEALVTDHKAMEQAEKRIQALEAELVEMSALVSEDPMTHSLNRRGMEQEYSREASRAMRQGTPFCVAMIDIDNFKRLNDTHGHLAGDEALIHLVRVAKEELRVTDIIGRMGGEEFMIMLPSTTLPDAVLVVERLQRSLTKKFFLNNNDRLLITFSAGVALYEAGESQESIMDRADKALYEAKHAGKNRVCTAAPTTGLPPPAASPQVH